MKLGRRRGAANSAPVLSDPVIIGGCGRSGTTLARVMIDSHRRIFCGPESTLLLRTSDTLNAKELQLLTERFDVDVAEIERIQREVSSRAQFIDRFLSTAARGAGKERWAEKTPRNVQHFASILEQFPNARLVHVVRNGLDVVCSLRTHPRHRIENGELVPVNTWKPIDECVDRWVTDVGAGLELRSDPRYTEVRYEDLVSAPEPTLRDLCGFIGEDWDDAMLRFDEVRTPNRDATRFPQNPEATQALSGDRLDRWKDDLTGDDLDLVMDRAGPLLRELGYL